MKKIFLFVIACCVFMSVNAQEGTTGRFTFPIKPGDSEWEQMDSPISRIISMQIPNNIIREIPTEELLGLCLDYPYIIDVIFADNYQKGIEISISEFNGFREVLKREDVVKVLVKKLESIPNKINSIKNKTDIEKGRFSFQCFFLELLIAQDAILSKMNQEQENSICASLFRNIEAKNAESDIFGEINSVSTSLILAKMALRNPNYEISETQREELNLFVKSPSFLNPIITDCLANYRRKMIE